MSALERSYLSGFLARVAGRGSLPIDPDLDPSDPGEPSKRHEPCRRQVRRAHPAILGSIAIGGFLGALARYGVGLALPAPSSGFPLGTFVVNTSGAFAIGLVLTTILERFAHTTVARPFLCVGFLGAWTTVSTVASDSVLLAREGRMLVAAGYVAATLVCGVPAAACGIRIGRRAVRAS
jgi:fluoride exporter